MSHKGFSHIGLSTLDLYFKDPNGIQLEYCCFTRNLNADDARIQERAEISIRRLGLTGARPSTPVENAQAG